MAEPRRAAEYAVQDGDVAAGMSNKRVREWIEGVHTHLTARLAFAKARGLVAKAATTPASLQALAHLVTRTNETRFCELAKRAEAERLVEHHAACTWGGVDWTGWRAAAASGGGAVDEGVPTIDLDVVRPSTGFCFGSDEADYRVMTLQRCACPWRGTK